MTLNRQDRLLAEIGIVAAVGCLAAITGLFAPPDTGFGARLAFAIGGFIAAWALVRVLAVVGAATARLLGLHPVWGYVLAIPLSSAAIAGAVLWFAGGTKAALGDEFARIWPQTALVGVGFFALFFVIYWRAYAGASVDRPSPQALRIDNGTRQTQGEPKGVVDTALHNRLPEGFPPILALSAEDHYVRVIAEDRSEMLLMPLAEAIDLMPGAAGEQVHRSWWVARCAVMSHRRERRDLRLKLVSGIEAPVSRAMVKPLREAGWL